MIFERIYDERLAQASYLIGCPATGEALVVDANQDIDQYGRLAGRMRLRITHVTETHIHADYLSGSRALAEATGARLYLSGEGGKDWSYGFADDDNAEILRDGSQFKVGNIRIEVAHTPGHTPEHLTFLVTDGAAADEPIGALTGDFIFVGDVGRPDLLEKSAGESGAADLYRSLTRFRGRPDWLRIWPGHGAGSACGKSMSAVPHSTLGYEKRFNSAFSHESEDEFIRAILEGQPEPPKYFAVMKRLNRDGPPKDGGILGPERLPSDMLPRLLDDDALVVDVRPAGDYAAAHLRGTINIPLNRSFPNWAGWLIPYDRDFHIIAESATASDAANDFKFQRKTFIKSGLLAGGTAFLSSLFPSLFSDVSVQQKQGDGMPHHSKGMNDGMRTVGQVNHKRNGFDPHEVLTDWERGTVSTLPNGQTLREFEIVASDKEIEIAPGIFFPAWTYNGRIPGPTLRCTEGDRIKINFINAGSHAHTIHFHGIHSSFMDGVSGVGRGEIEPTESFTYEFDAEPFGCHLYHCHSTPLKRHIHKGLYGAFIVDPDPDKHSEHREAARSRLLGTPENKKWQEMVIVMNGFDTNFDEENEVYAANSIAFAYMNKPIRIERERPVRIYLVNVTEFDPINSFHLHANFFDYYDHGTTLIPTLKTVDTVMQCQAQRGILEFSFKGFETGKYMFHAHQSEFAELGWMSFFDVVSSEVVS